MSHHTGQRYCFPLATTASCVESHRHEWKYADVSVSFVAQTPQQGSHLETEVVDQQALGMGST